MSTDAPQEDTFISHLVELRTRLLRAVIAVTSQRPKNKFPTQIKTKARRAKKSPSSDAEA